MWKEGIIMEFIFLIIIIAAYFLTYCLMSVASKADDVADEQYSEQLKVKKCSYNQENKGKQRN